MRRPHCFSYLLALQVPDTSLIDETRNVGPMSLLLIVPPVLRGDSTPVGFADGGFAGLVDDGFIPPIECSSVPFTSTL